MAPSEELWGPCWLQPGAPWSHIGSNFEESDVKNQQKHQQFNVFLVGRFEIEAKLVMVGPFLVILAQS